MNAEQRIKPVRKWGNQTVLERFMSKIIKDISGCWLWSGATNREGYGKFTVGRITVAAHRFIFAEMVASIPDHLCRVRHCVNPVHLEPVTMRENLLRGNTLQARNAAKTHCDHGHEFTAQNTRIVNGFWRACRECSLSAKEKKRRAAGMKYKGRYKTKCSQT